MGKRGPAPLPTAELELRGSWRAKHRGDEPQFLEGVPDCPDWLSDIGRAKWDELVEVLSQTPGLLTLADADALAVYCEAFEEFQWARAEIARVGRISKSAKGGEYQHPAVGIKNKALERMQRVAAAFGMSPATRTQIKTTVPTLPRVSSRDRSRFFGEPNS